MVAKGRSHKPAGELDPAAKLTERDVRAIRAADGVPNKQLAARFGVSVVTISRVRNRRSWQSVKP